jgi:pantoate--beta-alanine ligase
LGNTGRDIVRLVHTIAETRDLVHTARAAGRRVGLVPTMGALHAGHMSLVAAARAGNAFTVVSLFVNPTQFGPAEDFSQYPRTLEADAALCEQAGVDAIFAPAAPEMYPEGFATTVHVAGVGERLEGEFRPGHFDGVATVVAKLLEILQPDRAYFGQKDYQQLAVIRRLAADLNLPVEIVGCPTVREADGLALSSRNRYLSAPERAAAPAIYRALQGGAEALRAGGTPASAAARAKEYLATEPLFRVQYLEAAAPDTLAPALDADLPVVLLAAAYLGPTRLIDNLLVD